jgi:hypothetical protein
MNFQDVSVVLFRILSKKSPERSEKIPHKTSLRITRSPSRSCHVSDGYSPAFHSGGPGSCPGYPMWDVVDKVVLEKVFFRVTRVYPANIIIPCVSILIYHLGG